MGSNTSKVSNETLGQLQKNDLDIDANANSDPRSPTPEIVRTPLQGKPGTKHNITKNVDLRKTFENVNGEEKLIHNNPILSAVIKNHLQSYDPRSPTQEFERTPIVIASKIDDDLGHERKRLLNENDYGSPSLRNDDEIDESGVEAANSPDLVVSKNLCDGFYDMSLDDTLQEIREPLGSSTASNEVIEEDISKQQNASEECDIKPTKLLETNFDYIDNDKYEKSIENNIRDENKDDLKNIPLFKILDVDPRSPSIGIERTPIVVVKTTDKTSEENVEEMSDDTLIKVLQNKNVELRQNMTKERHSEGLLIYEDESCNVNETPKKSKSTSNNDARTPLSCMKNKTDTGHTRSKSANTLYEPKAAQPPKRVSHIPRLKSLSKQPKRGPTGSSISLKNITNTSVSGDCENTPPHSHRDRWDKDSSVVL